MRAFVAIVVTGIAALSLGTGVASALPSSDPSPDCSSVHGPPSASIPPDLQPTFACSLPSPGRPGPGLDKERIAEGAREGTKDGIEDQVRDQALEHSSPATIKKHGKSLWGKIKGAGKSLAKDTESAAKAVGEEVETCWESGACEASADDG